MLRVTLVQHCAQKKVRNVKNHMASGPTHVKSNPDRAETKKKRARAGEKESEQEAKGSERARAKSGEKREIKALEHLILRIR